MSPADWHSVGAPGSVRIGLIWLHQQSHHTAICAGSNGVCKDLCENQLLYNLQENLHLRHHSLHSYVGA